MAASGDIDVQRSSDKDHRVQYTGKEELRKLLGEPEMGVPCLMLTSGEGQRPCTTCIVPQHQGRLGAEPSHPDVSTMSP